MTFRSVDPAEAAQADFLVCLRVADLPAIGRYPINIQKEVRANREASTQQPCEKCGHHILVSAGNPAGVPRICTHCNQVIKALATRATRGTA